MLSKFQEIRRDDKCMDYAGGEHNLGVKDKIMIYICHGQGGNQNWLMEENGLIKHSSGFCIEILQDKSSIVMQRCDASNQRQIWQWKKRDEIKKS